jgi:hypothetical protein
MKVFRHALTMVFALACLTVAAAELPTQKTSERGVTVAATPLDLSPGAGAWEFRIVLDTHSQDLSDDLMQIALLLDDAGRKHSPVAWEGAGPGGHHREGVLKFRPLAPAPAAVELQIQRAGEAKPRSFRWQLR